MLKRHYSILMIILICLSLAGGCGIVERDQGNESTLSVASSSNEGDQKDRIGQNPKSAYPPHDRSASSESDKKNSVQPSTGTSSIGTPRTGNGVIRTIDDWRAMGLTRPVRTLVCSGSGALRLVTFLNCSDRVIAVEQIEKRTENLATYRVAHPEYANLPVFGEGHGRDNIEVLLKLEPRPDLIVRIDNPGAGIDPKLLQSKTGIPVLLLPYGDFGEKRAAFDGSIRLLGEVLGKSDRANELLTFIDSQIKELRQRSTKTPAKTNALKQSSAKVSPEKLKETEIEKKATVYLGGLSYRGSHGFNSTSISYPPLDWLNLKNIAAPLNLTPIRTDHVMIAREQILAWNPDYVFLDLGTIALGDSNGWSEVSQGAIYRSLKTVKTKKIYSLYPNNFYSANYDAILANAWFIGSIVYPDQFADIVPKEKAEEIFRFMTGGNVLARLPESVQNDLFVNLFDSKK